VSDHLPRWHGVRLIAADALHLRFAIRNSHPPRPASRDQLTVAEIMLATLGGLDGSELSAQSWSWLNPGSGATADGIALSAYNR
jgi:hypothetical protein